jgi:hypothetical protein
VGNKSRNKKRLISKTLTVAGHKKCRTTVSVMSRCWKKSTMLY